MRVTTPLVLLSLASGVAACFVGYDSRWGEAKRAQQRAAEQSKPAAISASAEASQATEGAHRTFHVRVRTTGRYLAQTIDAPKQIADLVEDANGVLAPTLGLRLEVERIQPWSSDADEDLHAALEGLSAEDPGSDVDLVVGMIGALPRQTDSLHELGIAHLLGKQVVVRAASRLGEHDQVQQTFSDLSDDERARIARLRKRHRALAVFLHEVGHALGALHENDERSLMHPSYSPKMSGFGGGALALMRVAIDASDRAAAAGPQLALLRSTTDADWVAVDRDQQVARLEAATSAAAEARDAGPASAAGLADAPAELRGDDGDRYVRASQMLRAGRVGAAFETARPLFSAYPDVYAVQDLRCQLAMLRWLERDAVRAECASVVRLGDAGVLDAAR